jgi:HAD superfamily hydrolase (TIGR01549 family)
MKNGQVIEKLKAKQYKAVIFDFDGTILDVKKPLDTAVTEVFNEKGINTDMEATIHEIGAILESIQGYPIPKILLQSYDIFQHITALQKHSFLKKFRIALKIFSKYQVYSKDAQLFPGIIDLLEYLKDLDLYIVSHNQTNNVIEHLQEKGIEKYFKNIFGADKLTVLKPNPDALLPVLEQYNKIGGKNFLILGDMPSDIESGKEAGIQTLAIASGISERELLSEYHPDLLVDSISELLNLLGIKETHISESNG